MGIRKRFNKVFSLEDSIEDEKRRFVNRVNQSIFHVIDTEQWEFFDYKMLYSTFCSELGVNAHDYREREEREMTKFHEDLPAKIRTLTDDNFEETLIALCTSYNYIKGEYFGRPSCEWLSMQIKSIMSRCTCDIGIRWKDGFFYPSGAEDLDKPLIEETLTWLNDYPNESKNYQTALQYYIAGNSLPDVITNCYSAVEGVVRSVLKNGRTLDKNKDELLAKINLSDGWKSLLANYINYAHDYRHASEERHEITEKEAEAYLYMTGLIIRLIIESI